MAQIEIDGTYNVRSIGGSADTVLVRAAALDTLSAQGLAALAVLKLALVIDLREHGERGQVLHPTPVAHLPIYRAVDGPPQSGSLESIYELMLETRGTELVAAVAAIAEADGPVLVHCTAGKDRTGLVVALALLAAGLPLAEVRADYIQSGDNVAPHRRAIAEEALRLLEPALTETEYTEAIRLHLDSPAAGFDHAVAVLDRYNGVESYLLRHGLTVEQFSLLRERLGGENR